MSLVGGKALVIDEDLDISRMGLYKEKDPNVPDDDYIEAGCMWMGKPLWKRKSEEGIKWRVFDDTKLKPWAEILKKKEDKS